MDSFNPKVSIIIPVYNGSNYMREAIDSALAQTYDNLEVIVVNDGSTDNTEDIALSYGDKIRYFSKPNGGVSTALNLGIANMKGEYFSWLSHDDLYLEDKISSQINFLSKLENKNLSIIFGNWHNIDKYGNKLNDVNLSVESNELLLKLLVTAPLHGCTLLVPKTCFEIEGGFKTELRNTQDVELFFRFAQKFEFHLLKNNMVAARHHENQVTHLTNKRHIQESSQFLTNAIKQLGIDKLSEITKKTPRDVKKLLLNNWSKRGYPNAREYLIKNYSYTLSEKIVSKYYLSLKQVKREIKNLRIH